MKLSGARSASTNESWSDKKGALPANVLMVPKDCKVNEAFHHYNLNRLFEFAVDDGVYETCAPHVAGGRIYGGQLLGQALAALQRTVPKARPVHSMHAYFIRPGLANTPLRYHTFADRDGRSFSARRVEAWQGSEMLFLLAASFHQEENGPKWQSRAPDSPPPETLTSIDCIIVDSLDRLPPNTRAFWGSGLGVDYRPIGNFSPWPSEPREAKRQFRFRSLEPLKLADDAPEHRALLAYASDMHILDTAFLPLGMGWASPGIQDASLDHSIWFHAPFRFDDWLLYDLDVPVGTSNRYLRA